MAVKAKLCVICGKRRGKHYFGKMEVPVGKGKYKQTGTFRMGKSTCKVVKWTGKKNVFDYWECDKCYKK